MTRAFAEPLRSSPKGALINTSSIGGLQVNVERHIVHQNLQSEVSLKGCL